MADVNARVLSSRPGPADSAPPDEPLWDLIELLFFAYRDFVGDPDDVLARFGFGRAHHRVLHFVNRNPGMKVADLLDILKITKQSLGRVLKQLIDEGYVEQKEGANDRRQRLLYVTPKGAALAMKLASLQTTRIARALRARPRRARDGAAVPRRAARRRRSQRRARVHRPRRPGAAPDLMPGNRTMVAPPIVPDDDAPHLLVVDDDGRIRALLSRYLNGAGYRVTTAESAADARAKLGGLAFDLLILDVMMPGETGFDLAKSIRQSSAVPILMLTARAEKESRIAGLEIGADDYVAKPFEPRELSLRVANILKRTQPAAAPVAESLRFGPFVFHIGRGELRKGEDIVHLTDRERDMFRLLAASPGETVTRTALAGNGVSAGERAVDVQVNRLRRKIEKDPANPLIIQTVRGIGYRLVVST
jgi:two-component system phosphate regulon response regulator OmpR